jgi:endonuclease/exonuclease/phosphatase family metal-dependent hydrolase
MPKHFFFALLFVLTFCYAGHTAELRVLCYNIHIGIGMDNKLDLERTAKLIKEQKPDLVALQEVDRNAGRTEKQDQPALLEKLTGLKAVYGKTLDRSNGDYGIVILSRFPIKSSKMTVFEQGTFDTGRYEQRGLLEAEIELENKEIIRFANTHLCHLSEERRTQQVKQINELLKQSTGLAILCGDFNAIPGSETINAVLEQWTDATDETPTFSSTKPEKKIDYIFYRPQSRLRIKEMKVLDDSITSDHLPVLVVFEILP